mmetsp:Transcript_143256/g.445287  ORF Transcript_143256/g.445287 Transcript_143256/m.445287 type:complete len:269 (+) Transcript_143256:146-952(+)
MHGERADDNPCDGQQLRVELHLLHRHCRRGQHTVGHVHALQGGGLGVDPVEVGQHVAHEDRRPEVVVELLAGDAAVAVLVEVLPHGVHGGHRLGPEDPRQLLVGDALAPVHVQKGENDHGARRVKPKVNADHQPDLAVPSPHGLGPLGDLAQHGDEVHRPPAVLLGGIRLRATSLLEHGQGFDYLLVVALFRLRHLEALSLLELVLHALHAREAVERQEAGGVVAAAAEDLVEVRLRGLPGGLLRRHRPHDGRLHQAQLITSPCGVAA